MFGLSNKDSHKTRRPASYKSHFLFVTDFSSTFKYIGWMGSPPFVRGVRSVSPRCCGLVRMLCSVVCTPLIRSDVVVVFVNFCWNSIVDVVGTRRAYRFASLHPPYLCPVRNQNVLSFMFSNLLLCVCVFVKRWRFILNNETNHWNCHITVPSSTYSKNSSKQLT